MQRVFLFLQTHCSFFGRDLVREMRRRGAECHVINLSLGDWIFRIGTGATNYRGTLGHWREYLRDFIERNAITDIVYYADQLPYHRVARSLANELGVNCHAYELGYLRPDWITLERGGMGPFSHFPDDPKLITDLARRVGAPAERGHYPYPFALEAACEVVYHLTPVFMPYVFPRYVSDRYYNPLVEYLSYVPRLVSTGRARRAAQSEIDRLIGNNVRFFVVPMQLQSDYQIRRASPYRDMREMVDEVLESFAQNAAPDTHLVFKIHPHDNNLERWPTVIRKRANAYGIEDRVTVLDGGDLDKLLIHSAGVILINSTTGLAALRHGVPVKVLGIAVFDVAGMTDQGDLGDFWNDPSRPDKALVEAFLKLLTASIQVKGNFYTRAGRRVAIRQFTDRLMNEKVNDLGAFVTPPPRLAKARSLKVPMIHEDLDYR